MPPIVNRLAPLLLLATGCGVVIADPDDAGLHPDAAPFTDATPPDAGEPLDTGAPDTGDLEDSTPMDVEPDTGLTDVGVTHTLSVNVVGPGRVVSTPDGIDCRDTCTATFPTGTSIRLAARPDADARVANWSVPCASALDSCTFTLVQDLAITVEMEIRPPIVTTGQAADLVLGQPDFFTTAAAGVTGSSLNFPTQCAAFGSRLWVVDPQNHRVLQWDSVPILNQTSASHAIGQENLFMSEGMVDEQSIASVSDIATDGRRLFVQSDNRILGFDPIPNLSGLAASFVLGQSDFTSTIITLNSSQFGSGGMTISDGRLFVADQSHNRVLIWNLAPTTSGLHGADVVLGQPSFTSATAANPPNASSLNYPYDVAHDPVSGKLAVADTLNNRILIWNSVPTAHGQPADVVLGQSGFQGRLANAGGPTPNELGVFGPRALTIAHNTLFVADFGNARVMVWHPIPSTSGEPASFVLGRASFNESGNPDIGPTTVGYAHGVCVLESSLYVVNSNWDRVTRFALQL